VAMPENDTTAIAESGTQGARGMWPPLETASRIYDIANIFLILGAAVGIASTCVIVWMGNVKESHWDEARDHARERIVQLETQQKLATAEIEDAKARALEAQVALEIFKAPRTLSPGQKALIQARMKPFPGTQFAMAAVGAEPLDFATEIADALKAAGWQWINWPLGGAITKPPGRPDLGLDMLKGIETHIFDVELQPLATELFLALGAAGHKNEWVLKTPARPELAKTVIILIGSKP
jgi:hypothetical protein